MKVLAKNLQWYQRLNMVGRLERSAPDWTTRRWKSLNWLHLQSLHLSTSSPLNYSRSSYQEFVTCSVLINSIYWGHKHVSKTINVNSISHCCWISKKFKLKVRKSFWTAHVRDNCYKFVSVGSQIRPGRNFEIGRLFRFLENLFQFIYFT